MLPDGVSNPGPLTLLSGALPIALRGPAQHKMLKVYLPETLQMPSLFCFHNLQPQMQGLLMLKRI